MSHRRWITLSSLFGAAVFVHATAFVLLSLAHFTEYGAEMPVIVETSLEQREGDVIDEALERDVFENEKEINTDEPSIEDPILKDADIFDHNETDNNEDYESSKGVEDAISGKPFQGKYWNSAVGVGGGAGGNYGGRYGGRRNLRGYGGASGEGYDRVRETPARPAGRLPLSTFSVDVDTASYANVRRFLTSRVLPPPDAVRIEEMINYFDYRYPAPSGDTPFSILTAVAECPWNPGNRIVRIGLKGREIRRDRRPPSNFVFLIDVSGSMRDENKLPLLKRSLKMLVQQLGEDDYVGMVTYASDSGLALPSTCCSERSRILEAINRLYANGSTNGGAGIRQAYDEALRHLVPGGVNRVILATDGDFNVGITDRNELVRFIQSRAKAGISLTVLGFGTGNYKDDRLEALADKGNGNYAYIDSTREAKKVLCTDLSGTLVTIAKDMKIQVEFNPVRVASWRLIGYENRILKHEEFNDDRKDAGDIGAGHTVTALYEITPAMGAFTNASVDPLKYQVGLSPTEHAYSNEILTVKLRYKTPLGSTSRCIEFPVVDSAFPFREAPADVRFACAVAAFGMVLRNSPYRGTSTYDSVLEMAKRTLGTDPGGYRSEFVGLVHKARRIAEGR